MLITITPEIISPIPKIAGTSSISLKWNRPTRDIRTIPRPDQTVYAMAMGMFFNACERKNRAPKNPVIVITDGIKFLKPLLAFSAKVDIDSIIIAIIRKSQLSLSIIIPSLGFYIDDYFCEEETSHFLR